MASRDGYFDDFLHIVPILTIFSPQTRILLVIWNFLDNIGPTFDHFFSTNNDFVGNLEWKMCLYIVDNVSTCGIIYFRYVDTEKRINNSPFNSSCTWITEHSRCSECNCKKNYTGMLLLHILSIINQDWLQHASNVCVVYECVVRYY